jgi:hypothetical protein
MYELVENNAGWTVVDGFRMQRIPHTVPTSMGRPVRFYTKSLWNPDRFYDFELFLDNGQVCCGDNTYDTERGFWGWFDSIEDAVRAVVAHEARCYAKGVRSAVLV